MPLMGELTRDQMGVTYVSDILKQESGFSDTKAKGGPGQAQGPPNKGVQSEVWKIGNPYSGGSGPNRAEGLGQACKTGLLPSTVAEVKGQPQPLCGFPHLRPAVEPAGWGKNQQWRTSNEGVCVGGCLVSSSCHRAFAHTIASDEHIHSYPRFTQVTPVPASDPDHGALPGAGVSGFPGQGHQAQSRAPAGHS